MRRFWAMRSSLRNSGERCNSPHVADPPTHRSLSRPCAEAKRQGVAAKSFQNQELSKPRAKIRLRNQVIAHGRLSQGMSSVSGALSARTKGSARWEDRRALLPVRGLKCGQSPYRALTVTTLAFPTPDARRFFPPPSFMGSCQTPVKKTILAEPSGGGLRCVPFFSGLKTMTSPIFVYQYYNWTCLLRETYALRFQAGRAILKNQRVTTNDMGQLNAHPPNGPATVCPSVSPRRRACWRPTLNATAISRIRPRLGDPRLFHHANEAGEKIMASRGATPTDGAAPKSGAIGQFETAIRTIEKRYDPAVARSLFSCRRRINFDSPKSSKISD
jgi:hypothetical protein